MTEPNDVLILEEFLPYRLSVLSNIVSNSISSIYAERYGLSVPAWRVMAVLGRSGGLSAAEVAERTAMDKVAVSRAVSLLLQAGYINRSFAGEDRRRSALGLSDKGREVYRQVIPLALSYEQQLLAALTPESRQVFDRLLRQLAESAEKLVETIK